MTAALLDLARRTWPLPWGIDERADPLVVAAEHGALVVAIATTRPLTIIGSLADTEFFEAETDDVPAALAELEGLFRRLVDVPALARRRCRPCTGAVTLHTSVLLGS
jgi:hypothetical protein